MDSEFGPFVAEYTKKIVDELLLLRGAPPAAPEAAAPEDAAFIELDATAAERTASGTYIFPQVKAADNWCFFGLKSPHNPVWYTLLNRLAHDSSTDELLEAAYQAILLRPVDPDGRANYKKLIESGQLTRRGLFFALANSGEAQDRQSRLLLVPEANAALSPHEVQPGGTAPLIKLRL